MNFYTQKTIILMIVVCIISDSGFSDDVVCLDCLDTLNSVEIPITTETYETYTFFFDWWTKNCYYNYSGNVSSDILCTVEKWGNKYGLEICNSTVKKRTKDLKNAEEYCIMVYNRRINRVFIIPEGFIESCTTEIRDDGLKYDYGFDNFAFQRLNFNIESNLSESTKMYIEYLNKELPTIENSGEYAMGTGPLCCIKDLKAAGFKNFNGKHYDNVYFASSSRRSSRLSSQMHDLSLSPTDVNLSGSYNIDRYIENEEYLDRRNIKYSRQYVTVGSYNRNLIRNEYFDDCDRITNIVTREYCQFVHDNYDSQIKVIDDIVKNEIQHTEELMNRSYLENYKRWCWHYYRNQ